MASPRKIDTSELGPISTLHRDPAKPYGAIDRTVIDKDGWVADARTPEMATKIAACLNICHNA